MLKKVRDPLPGPVPEPTLKHFKSAHWKRATAGWPGQPGLNPDDHTKGLWTSENPLELPDLPSKQVISLAPIPSLERSNPTLKKIFAMKPKQKRLTYLTQGYSHTQKFLPPPKPRN